MLAHYTKHLLLLAGLCSAMSLAAQDSLNMVRVGHWDPTGMVSYAGNTYNDIWGYTTPTGEEYAIIGNVDSILVVDITDCANPTRVYGYDGGNTTIWRDIKTFGTYAYSVCDNCSEGLHIFDMSALPGGAVQHELTTTEFFTKAHNIYIDTATEKLYATGTNTAVEGFVILDLSSTPEDPSLIAELELDDEIGWPTANFYVHDVYVKNDTAYASHGYQGYYVWDLTDLNNIEVLGDYDAGGYNHSSWTTDDGLHAYFAEEVPTGRPMHVLDLANLGSGTLDIQSINTFQHSLGTANGSTPHNPFIVNDTLYISYYHDGLKAYDLSNPAAPVLVGYYDTYPNNGTTYAGYEGAWGTYPFFDSGCICVSDVEHGLNIIKNCDIQTYWVDSDSDGYGNGTISVTVCEPPSGYVTNKDDCDDTDPDINPGQPEVCDGIDNNCDGYIDEGVLTTFYLDDDNDGYGDAGQTILACTLPSGYVANDADCNDGDANINPGATEVCDEQDNNCDGSIDEGVSLTFYLDDDNDGYGDAGNTTMACSAPLNYVANDSDCNDTNPTINPAASEVCDGIDNNCDGNVDEGVLSTFYLDDDNDGFGDAGQTTLACTLPSGYASNDTDCNDNDATINPAAAEACDGIDNNCNGSIDENCTLDPCDAINLYLSSHSQNNYRVKEELDSDATLTTGQNISYFAGVDIDLLADFEVAMGAEFLAQIEDCDETLLTIVNDPMTAIALAEQLEQESGTEGGLYLLYNSEHKLEGTYQDVKSLLAFLAGAEATSKYTLGRLSEK